MTGILDEYPGAAAAYSLRLLNTDYTGDAVTVRRSSDNQTINIGFVDGELNTGALNTFCSGADGFVTVWHDQSGNGNNATQSTASSQPKIFDSVNGIIEVNGKPAVYTDGVDDFIESPSLSLSNPTTQFFIFKTLGTSTSDVIGGLRFGLANAPSLICRDINNLSIYQQGPEFSPKIPHDGNQILVTAKSSTIGTDWAAFYNSNTVLNGGEDIGSITGSLIRFGSQGELVDFGENYLQEYILYDSDETGNRVGIETNINDFYSID